MISFDNIDMYSLGDSDIIKIGKSLHDSGEPKEAWEDFIESLPLPWEGDIDQIWENFSSQGTKMISRIKKESTGEGAKAFPPDLISLGDLMRRSCQEKQELIKGVLKTGAKLILTGGSKTGKSFALINLAVALATGNEWLGFECSKSKVLFVNSELDEFDIKNRFKMIIGDDTENETDMDDILILNLRGNNLPFDALADRIIEIVNDNEISSVIIDPIYKLFEGDENNASAVRDFTGTLDHIISKTGASIFYSHHHAKGNQANRKSIDRGSGSGVFARDADAFFDLSEVSQNSKNTEIPLRLEVTLRSFPAVPDKYFWFDAPSFIEDTEGIISSGKYSSIDTAERLESAFKACEKNGSTTVDQIASFLNLTPRTIRSYINSNAKLFQNSNGIVTRR